MPGYALGSARRHESWDIVFFPPDMIGYRRLRFIDRELYDWNIVLWKDASLSPFHLI